MTYYDDYPKKPMGKPNPYYGCAYCGVSDPQINGDIYNHHEDCEYRIIKELELEIEELKNDHKSY